ECQAVRAPGSKVTLAPTTRAGSGASNNGSTRTMPVKYWGEPLPEGCEPILLTSVVVSFRAKGFAGSVPQRGHIDHEAVFHVAPQQPLIGFVDVPHLDHLDVRDD